MSRVNGYERGAYYTIWDPWSSMRSRYIELMCTSARGPYSVTRYPRSSITKRCAILDSWSSINKRHAIRCIGVYHTTRFAIRDWGLHEVGQVEKTFIRDRRYMAADPRLRVGIVVFLCWLVKHETELSFLLSRRVEISSGPDYWPPNFNKSYTLIEWYPDLFGQEGSRNIKTTTQLRSIAVSL